MSSSFYSRELQDVFAHKLIGDNGFFLDFGSSNPNGCRGERNGLCSNTAALEKNFGWKGLLFDIYNFGAGGRKSSKFFQVDCKETQKISQILDENLDLKTVDYVSIDTEWNATLPILDALFASLEGFKVMTLEHDSFRGAHYAQMKEESREKLFSRGYFLLFGDIRLEEGHRHAKKPWEDWWINPSAFSKEVQLLQENDLPYMECISRLEAL